MHNKTNSGIANILRYMTVKVGYIICGIAMLIITGCHGFKKGEGDLLYKILKDSSGSTIKEGDFTAMTFTIKTEKGAVLYNSADDDNRLCFKFREASNFKGDFFSALGLLSEGDSAVFKINADSAFAIQNALKHPNTRDKYLTYTIKVNKVISRGTLNDSLYNNKIEAFKVTETAKAKQLEYQKIKNYLQLLKVKPAVTASGLNYVIKYKGAGSKPEPGDTVTLQYTATFLSGKVIETSDSTVAKRAGIFNSLQPYGLRKMQVVTGKSLSGFNEALTMFPKGTKVTLIIPSQLAYGSYTYSSIQPYTALLCQLEIVNISHPSQSYNSKKRHQFIKPISHHESI